MTFQRAFFSYTTIAVWLVMDVEVAAYYSGCNGGYCFVISTYTDSNERLDLATAQKRCQSNGTQLIEIRSQDIQDSLVNVTRSVFSQGLSGWNLLINAMRSILNSWLRLNGNGVGSLSVSGQSGGLSLAYGYLKPSTSGFDLFASKPNDNKGGFICSGPSFCSDGVPLSGQCYQSYTETLSWYEARNRCLMGGGDLASFDYITTNAGFNALNGSWINPSNNYWIGIRRESWKWQYSSLDVKYSDWMTGHPINDQSNTDCLCLSTTEWKWIECGCTQQLPFVCISERFSTSRTPISTITFTLTITRSSKPTLIATSESSGLPTPTITVSNSITAKNATSDMDPTCRLTEVGIAVGLGVGIPLIIVIAVLAVMVTRWKKKYRQAMLLLDTNQRTSSKNEIQQSATGDVMHELNDAVGDPYESLKPRLERTSVDGLYQTLDPSTKTDI